MTRYDVQIFMISKAFFDVILHDKYINRNIEEKLNTNTSAADNS